MLKLLIHQQQSKITRKKRMFNYCFVSVALLQCFLMVYATVSSNENQPEQQQQQLLKKSSSLSNNARQSISLRSNLYFGTTSKRPDASAIKFGFAWSLLSSKFTSLRYEASDNDGLKRWGWKSFLPDEYGEQVLEEDGGHVKIENHFFHKNEFDWKVHFNFTSSASASSPPPPEFVSMFIILSGPETLVQIPSELYSSPKGIRSDVSEVLIKKHGVYSVFWERSDSPQTATTTTSEDIVDSFGFCTEHTNRLKKNEDDVLLLPVELQRIHFTSFRKPSEDAWKVREIIQNELQASIALAKENAGSNNLNLTSFVPLLSNKVHDVSHLMNDLFHHRVIVFQKVFKLPKSVSFVVREEEEDHPPQQGTMETLLDLEKQTQEMKNKFSLLFEEAFHLKGRQSEAMENMGKHALANLLGSQMFFYGSNLVMMEGGKQKKIMQGSLFTGVPSRSFFPRGFLWDEGFHQLVTARFNRSRSMEILSSWFSRFDENGWVAREQILGSESISKVPQEFLAQSLRYANPPTLVLPLYAMFLKKTKSEEGFFKLALETLKKNYFWLIATQQSQLEKKFFAWQGRSLDGKHTLTSGIDDYPRCYGGFLDKEAHVDLLSWVAWYEGMLAAMVEPDSREYHLFMEARKSHVEILINIFWNPAVKFFNDMGVVGQKYPRDAAPDEELHVHFCPHVGYVGLMPFALQLIPVGEEEKIESILSALNDENLLKSPFGIRSLSKKDFLYGKEEDYWRGNVWVNVNYLIIQALDYYSKQVANPSLRALCAETKKQIKTNLLQNVLHQYTATGFLYENYHPDSGKGRGTKPFTGWTSLVLLLMSEL